MAPVTEDLQQRVGGMLSRARERAGGVLVTNVIGALEGPRSRLFRSLYRTYRAAFPTVLVHPVAGASRPADALNNLVLVATAGAAPDEAFLAERWRELRRRAPQAPDLSEAISARRAAPVSVADVPLLTDDYAPTDALLLVGE